jgi:hypothetical protein
MDDTTYAETRRSVHGLAELVLAGPRYRSTGQLRLRVLPDGIGTWDQPGPRFAGGEIVTEEIRVPVDGLTFEEAASRVGLRASALDDVYHDGPGAAPSETIRLEPEALRVLEEAFAVGDGALAAFLPDVERVLWPEHFDVALTADRVNYGVSPGDSFHARPYAYVGPHEPRHDHESGEFWNAPFGAARALSDLGDVDAVLAFFQEGQRLV